jgi:hypothetical protein
MSKKKDKRIAHATMVWEREQLHAAFVLEQISKAFATVMHYKDELTEEEIARVNSEMADRKKAIENYVLSARDKYVSKMAEFDIEVLNEENV